MNQDDNDNSYIKINNNIIINKKCIRWVKKMDECLEICTLLNGCYGDNTFKLCKINNLESYTELNKHFKE
jgi:hypothetical protein